MKNPRIVLAFIGGLLLALGYAVPSDGGQWDAKGIVVGMGLGAMMTISWIRSSEYLTKSVVLYVSGPLLCLWVLAVARTGTSQALHITAVVALALFAVQMGSTCFPLEHAEQSGAPEDS